MEAIALRVVNLLDFGDLYFQPLVGCAVGEVALHVIDPFGEPFPEIALQRTWRELFHLRGQLFTESIGGHGVERESDDRELR